MTIRTDDQPIQIGNELQKIYLTIQAEYDLY